MRNIFLICAALIFSTGTAYAQLSDAQRNFLKKEYEICLDKQADRFRDTACNGFRTGINYMRFIGEGGPYVSPDPVLVKGQSTVQLFNKRPDFQAYIRQLSDSQRYDTLRTWNFGEQNGRGMILQQYLEALPVDARLRELTDITTMSLAPNTIGSLTFNNGVMALENSLPKLNRADQIKALEGWTFNEQLPAVAANPRLFESRPTRSFHLPADPRFQEVQ